jgi:hypothetical protein
VHSGFTMTNTKRNASKSSINPSVNVRVALRVFDDASGAPAVLEYRGYAFACDCLGEIKMRLIAPVSGTRLANRIAADVVRTAYGQLLEQATNDDWRTRNASMYA